MASLASKNLYDLLGNTEDQDPDREPEPPTKAIEKTLPRTGKRNAGSEAPAAPVASRGRGGSRGGREPGSGNDAAFRDRNAGSANNRSHAPEGDFGGDRRGRGDRGGRGRGFGGRGGRGGRDDRHSKTGLGEHEKQAGGGWGRNTGDAEFNDEKAGEAIAKEEEKEGFDSTVPPPVNADGETYAPEATDGQAGEPEAEAEPEIQTKSYDEFLAEKAQKKLEISEKLQVRKANEGASKKFPEGKAISRDEEEDFMAGTGGKNKRNREQAKKEVVDLTSIDPRQFSVQEPAPAGGRGGRGGRGRGGERGDRGGDRAPRGDRPDRGGDRGDFRGRGRGRGDGFRGGRGGDRGGSDFRGGRGASRGASGYVPKIEDNTAFPSLGS